jgi:hypothetical protein
MHLAHLFLPSQGQYGLERVKNLMPDRGGFFNQDFLFGFEQPRLSTLWDIPAQ